MKKTIDTPPNEAERGFDVGTEVAELEKRMDLVSEVTYGRLKGNEALRTLASSVYFLLRAKKRFLVQSLDSDPTHS